MNCSCAKKNKIAFIVMNNSGLSFYGVFYIVNKQCYIFKQYFSCFITICKSASYMVQDN